MMHRRQLLAAAAAIPFSAACPARAATPARRARPGDPAWPDPAQWETLSARVGGRLIRPAPLLAPCETDPKSDPCRALFKNLTNPYFIGDQPAGTQVSGWQDAWSPAASAWAVAASTPADIVAAVNFARVHDLRLAVKGGGHSYQGTSNAPDSLLIWTRAMNAITLHDAFVAEGCAGVQAPTPAVTIEAGAMWMDAYDAVTTKAGRYVQGGGCATVGVAGLIQSGGFGSFSKRYGLACANLLQAKVVTADGVLRTVNARRDPELFWGLKGGGGGSLGVVTELTLRTYDLPDRLGGCGLTIKAATDAAFQRLIARFVAFYTESLMNPHWGESVHFGGDNSLKVSMVSQGLDDAAAMAVWRPFLDFVAAGPDLALVGSPDIGVLPAREWWNAAARRAADSRAMHFDERPGAPAHHAWWADDQEQVGAFLYGYDSLWLPAALLRGDGPELLVGAVFDASRRMDVALHFNKGLAGAPPDVVAAARDTATHPDVQDAFALAIIATGGPPAYASLVGFATNPAFGRKKAADVAAAAAALRRIAPRAGSYLSESDYFNASWRDAFWGRNYPRLRAAKARYDPDGLFTVHHGVGSDAWSADGFTRIGSG